MNDKKLLLLELNEVNFDVAKKYMEQGFFPGLSRLMQLKVVRTKSEIEYQNLEPWIQWPSVHYGLSFEEHKIFRLGDVVNFHGDQIFEKVEKLGYKVGCVSPMNASNRLQNPAYFIPDPWTKTLTDGSWCSKFLSEAISQAVNDNSKRKISFNSIIVLALAFVSFAPIKHIGLYLKYAITAKWRPWRRALFLDLLLHDIHANLCSKKRAQFSTLFLNACAHIQHHYFFNSPWVKKSQGDKFFKNPGWYISADCDPLREVLELYDLILEEYLSRKDFSIIVATGLTQIPYDTVKFYYRLKSHGEFLKLLGVKFTHIKPLMTRDFIVFHSNESEAIKSYEILNSAKINGVKFFGEIDNRGCSLFVTLSYPNEIREMDMLLVSNTKFLIYQYVSFVAIKNGMHHGDGFAFFSKNLNEVMPGDREHVKKLHHSIMHYFSKEA